MSRYIVDMNTGKPDDFIRFVSEDYFVKEGFKQELRDGEVIWRKGSGWLTAPQFIKLLYQNGQVHLEAWLKYPLLPGVFVGEMGVTGFFAALPKSMLKSSVDTLVALFYQQPAVPVAAPVPGQAPAVQQPGVPAGTPAAPAAGTQAAPYPPAGAYAPGTPYPQGAPVQPIPVAVHNPTGKATLSLVMGLVSLVGLLPFVSWVGILTAVIGIVNGRSGMKTTARKVAVAGFSISIVLLILNSINLIAGIINLFLFL